MRPERKYAMRPEWKYGLFAVVGYLIVVFAVALALDAPEIASVASAVVLGVAVTFWLLRER